MDGATRRRGGNGWFVLAGALLALAPGCGSEAAGPDDGTDLADATMEVAPDMAEALATDTPAEESQAALPTAAQILAPGPFAVGQVTLELEDPTRPTPVNGDYEGAASRHLTTVVWYPAPASAASAQQPLPAAADGGPWPLIAYAHGFFSFNTEAADLAALLASHGFVIAAPLFPLTNLGAPGGPNAADVVHQPGDLGFVIDRLLAASGDPADPLHNMVDGSRVGTMGVSLGAMTALLTGFHPPMRDARVKAVVGAASPGCYLPSTFFADAHLPVLLIHGTHDRILPYAANGPPLYAEAVAPKTFVTIVGGTHAGMAGLAKGLLEKDNSDQVGCDSLGGNTSVTPEAMATMSQQFGGRPYATVLAECPAVCGIFEPTGAPIAIDLQLRIVSLAAASFFRATLGNDPGSARYLNEGLALEGAAVQVELQR